MVASSMTVTLALPLFATYTLLVTGLTTAALGVVPTPTVVTAVCAPAHDCIAAVIASIAQALRREIGRKTLVTRLKKLTPRNVSKFISSLFSNSVHKCPHDTCTCPAD